MRLAWDGLPKDLPLSREDRRALRTKLGNLKDDPPPKWVAMVPGGVMLACIGIWMPVLEYRGPWWGMLAIGAAMVVQVVLSFWIPRRAYWPWRCRQMARAGYEVCPRCGYPQRDAPPDRRICSECGAARVEIRA